MALFVERVAMSAAMASLLMVRGYPREAWWMTVMVASSEKRGSDRPANPRCSFGQHRGGSLV
ncbi:hypothetical protein B5P43_35550 [Bacillus sp. SRB_336]|nr:hypothetical protein B5P43_35550 [Bacillus sp. SRB_336]